MIAAVASCSRESERCPSALDRTAQTEACCVLGSVETLRITARLFDESGIRWWVDYGTLLGLACGGRWFWNDDDCGGGVLEDDRARVFELQPKFEAEGFRFVYDRPRGDRFGGGDLVKIHWSDANDANTDVAFWHRRSDGMMDRRYFYGVDQFKGREFPASWTREVVRVDFEGLRVLALAQWEVLGALRYGNQFQHLVHAVRTGRDPLEASRLYFPAADHDGVRR